MASPGSATTSSGTPGMSFKLSLGASFVTKNTSEYLSYVSPLQHLTVTYLDLKAPSFSPQHLWSLGLWPSAHSFLVSLPVLTSSCQCCPALILPHGTLGDPIHTKALITTESAKFMSLAPPFHKGLGQIFPTAYLTGCFYLHIPQSTSHSSCVKHIASCPCSPPRISSTVNTISTHSPNT